LKSSELKIDPVTMTVIHSYLDTAAREMGIAMKNTSYSPLFNEGLDFTCAIFDEKGEIIAQAEFVPAQVGAMTVVAEWTINEVGIENFHDGDVILHNDPFRGGCHLPEYCVIAPVFYKDTLVAFVACIGHMTETGGMVPAGFPGDAIEVFQEGLRLPPVKIVDKGRDVEDIWNIILSNVRTPRYSYGDVKAMIGSLYVGRKRVTELIDKYGVDFFRRVKEELKDYSERRMRAEITEIPSGTYEWEEVFADNDGIVDKPFRIRIKVVVKGDEMIVDYTGSDKQALGPVNATYGVTASGTWNAILHLTSKDIPGNCGRHRPVKIIAPPGTVLNVEYPGASVGGNSETHPHIVDGIFGALARALPDRVPAELGGTSGIVTFGGIHPDTGEPYAMLNSEPCGWGGRPFADGNNAVNMYNGNCTIVPVEVLESRYPIVHDELKLNENSCGAGRYRGGLGLIRTYRIDGDLRLSSFIEREKVAPRGLQGGKDGSKATVQVRSGDDRRFRTFKAKFGVKCNGKFSDIHLKKGDVVKLVMPGGAGWGKPMERDLDAIVRDVEEGYISNARAIKDYCVAFKTEDGKLVIDQEKTKKMREMLRERRKRRG